jgi:hypothetical protein
MFACFRGTRRRKRQGTAGTICECIRVDRKGLPTHGHRVREKSEVLRSLRKSIVAEVMVCTEPKLNVIKMAFGPTPDELIHPTQLLEPPLILGSRRCRRSTAFQLSRDMTLPAA